MVLQQKPKRASIWGYADKSDIGKNVEIQVTKEGGEAKKYETVVKEGTCFTLQHILAQHIA